MACNRPGISRYRAALFLLCQLPAIAIHAADFRAGEVEGLFDVTLAYGLGARVNDADDDLVGIANGGKASSVNGDDDNLSYEEGIISNAARLNADLTLAWQNFGAYIRGYAFYDYENDDQERARTGSSTFLTVFSGPDTGGGILAAKRPPSGELQCANDNIHDLLS